MADSDHTLALFHSHLAEVIGDEYARMVMEHLRDPKHDLALRTDVAGLDNRMDSLDNRMDRLELQMDSLEMRMGSIENRMDRIESKLDRLDDHFHDMQAIVRQAMRMVIGIMATTMAAIAGALVLS